MKSYLRHSAEEMERLEKLWQLLDPEVCMRVKTHNTQTLEDYEPLSSYDIQTFLAESNLRTLAWARAELEKLLILEAGKDDYEHERLIGRNKAIHEAIKSLTPESL